MIDFATQDRTHNDQNQITTINSVDLTYDDNGNLTRDHHGRLYSYDTWNHLVMVTESNGALVEGFIYDGLGRRVQELSPQIGELSVATNDLFYSASWQILEEVNDINLTNNATRAQRNIWSPVYVNALVMRERWSYELYPWINAITPSRLYFSMDANDSVTAAYDSSVSLRTRIAYDAYGQAQFMDGSWSTSAFPYGESNIERLNVLYQGGHYNGLINAYDFQRRFYIPELMRWLTADPIGYGDGMNVFAFVHDGPVGKRDPSGLKYLENRGTFQYFFGDDPAGHLTSNITLRFRPKIDNDNCGCTKIGFVQIVRTKVVGQLTVDESLWKEHLDIKVGGDTLLYGGPHDFWEKGKSREYAELGDTPGWHGAEWRIQAVIQDFETVAVCLEGNEAGDNYGAILWGHSLGGKKSTRYISDKITQFFTDPKDGDVFAKNGVDVPTSTLNGAADPEKPSDLFNKLALAGLDKLAGRK